MCKEGGSSVRGEDYRLVCCALTNRQLDGEEKTKRATLFRMLRVALQDGLEPTTP